MGLSIHYSGSFNPSASLQELIDEVADIAGIFNWPCHIFESSFPGPPFELTYDDHIYGICFTPPGCETISLCFLSNGKMSSPVHLHFYGKASGKEDLEMLYQLSIKTQYAGMQVHMLVIKLLKHLKEKYFTDFELSDEGRYWETGEEAMLKEKFRVYNELLDAVSNAFENFPMKEGETPEMYFERVLNYKIKKS